MSRANRSEARFVCELLTGFSSNPRVEVGSEAAGEHLLCGSDPSAAWNITGAGVHPLHVAFTWHGDALWVADYADARDVRLDGAAVVDWQQVQCPAHLEFGSVSVRVTTSGRPAARDRETALVKDDFPAPLPEQHTRLTATSSGAASPDGPSSASTDLYSEQTVIQPEAQADADAPAAGVGGHAPPSAPQATVVVEMPDDPAEQNAVPGALPAAPGGGLAAPPGGGLAAPPAAEEAGQPAAHQPAAQPKASLLSRPKVRITLMLILTLAMGTVVLSRLSAGGGGATEGEQGQTAAVAPEPVEAAEPSLAAEAVDPREVGVAPHHPLPPDLAAQEAEAAALVLSGRYDRAIPLYEQLSEHGAVYGALVTTLRERLTADCADGIGPGGEPCAAP